MIKHPFNAESHETKRQHFVLNVNVIYFYKLISDYSKTIIEPHQANKNIKLKLTYTMACITGISWDRHLKL